jgi:hypothetical protein
LYQFLISSLLLESPDARRNAEQILSLPSEGDEDVIDILAVQNKLVSQVFTVACYRRWEKSEQLNTFHSSLYDGLFQLFYSSCNDYSEE